MMWYFLLVTDMQVQSTLFTMTGSVHKHVVIRAVIYHEYSVLLTPWHPPLSGLLSTSSPGTRRPSSGLPVRCRGTRSSICCHNFVYSWWSLQDKSLGAWLLTFTRRWGALQSPELPGQETTISSQFRAKKCRG